MCWPVSRAHCVLRCTTSRSQQQCSSSGVEQCGGASSPAWTWGRSQSCRPECSRQDWRFPHHWGGPCRVSGQLWGRFQRACLMSWGLCSCWTLACAHSQLLHSRPAGPVRCLLSKLSTRYRSRCFHELVLWGSREVGIQRQRKWFDLGVQGGPADSMRSLPVWSPHP